MPTPASRAWPRKKVRALQPRLCLELIKPRLSRHAALQRLLTERRITQSPCFLERLIVYLLQPLRPPHIATGGAFRAVDLKNVYSIFPVA